jgi:hypothetical protein
MKKPRIYCPSFCNKGHLLETGEPVNHECYVLNPEALKAEREDDIEKAIDIGMHHGKTHKGVKVTDL